MPARVLVIGLDMGDGTLIRHWIGQGRLPHLSALASSGAWFDLESTAEVLHTSVWPTFATGMLPGRHGVYYPYQPTPGQQLARHIEPEQYGATTFWKTADSNGRSCRVYDIPETFPERDFHGRALFDWGTWAWYGEPTGQPPGLLKELRSRFGNYPLGFEAKRLGFGLPDNLEQRLVRSAQYKGATAGWLLGTDPWDLAVVGFCETHPAGHYLWPGAVDGITGTEERVFGPLLNVYTAIDTAIGSLRQTMPSDVVAMVVSGDGVRPNRCAWHLLPSALQRLGYLAAGHEPNVRQPSTRSVQKTRDRLLSEAKRRVANALPWRIRNRIESLVQSRRIDWSRTRAFTLPTDLEGCIRLNVKGREPFGIVEPGAHYMDLCEEIRSRLEELVNPATDGPAVRRVWIRNHTYPGPMQEELPDLIVTWNDDAPFVALQSPRFGSIEGTNLDPRPGTHSTSGFLLAAGPGIRTGSGGRGHLSDVAPSILRLMGVSGWNDMDGRPLISGAGRVTGDVPCETR